MYFLLLRCLDSRGEEGFGFIVFFFIVWIIEMFKDKNKFVTLVRVKGLRGRKKRFGEVEEVVDFELDMFSLETCKGFLRFILIYWGLVFSNFEVV